MVGRRVDVGQVEIVASFSLRLNLLLGIDSVTPRAGNSS